MRCEETIIPPYFRCPISLDLLKDPVTLWTGQTYDRSCIERWLAAGNSTCPVTMQKLHDSSMVPNHTLRHLIHDWLHSNGYSHTDDLSQDQFSIARIKHVLESDAFALETKIRSLEHLHSLSLELPLNNSCLIELGFFQMVMKQLVLRNDVQQNLMLVEKALSCALVLMPFSELKCLNVLKHESSSSSSSNYFAAFLALLEKGTLFIKKALCLVIEAISLEPQTKGLCQKLGKSVLIVRGIVDIIEHKSGSSSPEAIEAAIRALSALASIDSNRSDIARNGAVEGLLSCLINIDEEGRKRSTVAMAAMEKLLSEKSAKEVVVNHPLGVRAVVKMVFRVSEHQGSESAVNALLIICSESEAAREKAIVDGVLTQLLLLLQSQSSTTTKTKARMLLNLLRTK